MEYIFTAASLIMKSMKFTYHEKFQVYGIRLYSMLRAYHIMLRILVTTHTKNNRLVKSNADGGIDYKGIKHVPTQKTKRLQSLTDSKAVTQF